jgi:hypothetical protein
MTGREAPARTPVHDAMVAWTHQAIERAPDLLTSLVRDEIRPRLGLDRQVDRILEAEAWVGGLARARRRCDEMVKRGRRVSE